MLPSEQKCACISMIKDFKTEVLKEEFDLVK